MTSLLAVDEAIRRMLDGAGPLPREEVPLHEAAGRVLAEPIEALRTQPPFDSSAMDGYAVRAADIASPPARLTVIGEAAAGKRFEGRVAAGEAVRIFTGAPVPEGADAILIQENARKLEGREIEAVETVEAGRHIRRAGLDFRSGQTILPAGRRLDPAALSLAAAANHATLPLVRKPLVAILATGDELVAPGGEPGPDQIVASNGYGIAATAAADGAAILDLGIAPDEPRLLGEALARAFTAEADILVTLGGASVGEHDLVRDALLAQDVEMAFWKVAIRPGKPIMFGRRGATRVLGLPGNPVSSLVCGHIFLRPLIARLLGQDYRPDLRRARLGRAMQANDTRRDYVRARITYDDGELVATPFERQDSSMLSTLAEANGLIVREPFGEAANSGESCLVLMLR